MTDIHAQQEKALELLKDWSKWAAGLNFGAATGCVIMLQQGVPASVRLFLMAAVVFFALSILVSSLIFALLPAIVQSLPINKKSVSIYDYDLLPSISLRELVWAQLGFFGLGAICLLIWVLMKL